MFINDLFNKKQSIKEDSGDAWHGAQNSWSTGPDDGEWSSGATPGGEWTSESDEVVDTIPALTGVDENAEELHTGDPVIITGPVKFKGATGEIVDFGKDKRFVVVNLYNHGKHSFHSSDVSFNDYADSDAEEADMYNRDSDVRNWAHDQEVAEHISKVKGGYELKSKKTGKNLGKYPTKAGAEKREREVEYFKHKNEGVAEGYILKKTNVNKYVKPGDPDEYTDEIKAKDTDYEIINNKTGQVVGVASWYTNDYFGPGALKITMKNGATRFLDITAREKGNPQSAFNRFVKDLKTSKKYKKEGVAENWPDYDDNQYSLTDSTGKELTLLRGNTPEEAIERAKDLIGSNEKLLATFGLVKLTPKPYYVVHGGKRQDVAEGNVEVHGTRKVNDGIEEDYGTGIEGGPSDTTSPMGGGGNVANEASQRSSPYIKSAVETTADGRTKKVFRVFSWDDRHVATFDNKEAAESYRRQHYYRLSDLDEAKGHDPEEDNFTADDIKNLERIHDLPTLKARAKELIKGKPVRRMKPEKISYFYHKIDELNSPFKVIKLMYDLLLAGEGMRVLGTRHSMNPNAYQTKFGESREQNYWDQLQEERNEKIDMLIKELEESVEEGSLEEVSNKTLSNYLTKVDADSRKHKMDPTKRPDKKASKSVMGFAKAFNKLDSRKEQGVAEGKDTWQKQKNPRAGGMSKKAVKSYRRSHPGSKIKTAVTKKPSKIKKGSSDDKRRKSFCARMRGMKKHNTSAKTKNDPNSNINKSLRRWHCESVEEHKQMLENAQQWYANHLAEEKKKITAKNDPCWTGYHMVGKKKKNGREVPNCVPGKKGD